MATHTTLKRRTPRRNVIKARSTRTFAAPAPRRRSGKRIQQPVLKPMHDHD